MPKGSVLQEVWRGHEQDRQGGAHAEWHARREVHGHAADEAESLQDHGLEDACQANTRDVLSPGDWPRTSATRYTRAESSPS